MKADVSLGFVTVFRDHCEAEAVGCRSCAALLVGMPDMQERRQQFIDAAERWEKLADLPGTTINTLTERKKS